ncbi:MAG: hypothetical protein QNK05_07715, partial [Myxococcota bacterium]|nr:hypothetical protein [Myxococcota bacterium]
EERVRRAGPGVVWIVTAHPAGPQTFVNLAAGLASMPVWQFVLAIVLAAPLRSGAYALLGTSILSFGVPTFVAISVALSVVLMVPLLIPSVRAFVLGEPVRDGAGVR